MRLLLTYRQSTLTQDYTYKTVAGPGQGLYREKGSRFLAFAYPVETEDEVKAMHNALKKEYFDARHHCFGYLIGVSNQKHRAFDDGEPNHSAGDPILGQIRSRGLTNTLVVVVRYFGGTKLGVGGLINAYRTAAADALEKAGIVVRTVTAPVFVKYDYPSTPDVMKLINDFDIEVEKQSFEDVCALRGRYKYRDQKQLRERLDLMKTMRQIMDFAIDDGEANHPA